jgi:D-serine deaminase-like pyridoxal phosphate-dependent protein
MPALSATAHAAALAGLDTPAVVIDAAKVEANLRRAQAYADRHGLRLRPHIKTHKMPHLALRQVELGAVGITCQKLGEAEVMADAGLADIFLPYNIVGAAKLARLAALKRRIAISVTADNAVVVEGYAAAFADADAPLTVLVECDTGMGRCGVTTPEAALELAWTIAAAPGLRFGGLMTFPATHRAAEARVFLERAIALLAAAGLPPAIISSGGTPDLYAAGDDAGLVTEYRPGTYVFSDRFQVEKGVGSYDDCALGVLTTVVSRPTDSRAVIDAGSKALTSDLLGLDGYGYLPAYPEARIASLSEEHGVIDFSASPRRPAIGERLFVIPNHVCPVVNLFDTVHVLHADGSVEERRVEARGRVG